MFERLNTPQEAYNYNARAMGREDVVSLLEQNLEQERHTLEEVKSAEAQAAAAA